MIYKVSVLICFTNMTLLGLWIFQGTDNLTIPFITIPLIVASFVYLLIDLIETLENR